MTQKLISGGWFPLNKDNTSFTSLHGAQGWSPIARNFAGVSTFAVPGTLRKFRMRLRDVNGILAAPAVGETYTVTVRKAEVDTDLEVVLDEDSSDKTDTINEVAISAGDQIDLKCVPGGGPLNDRYPLWSFEFKPDDSTESVYFVTGGLWYKNQAEGYFTLTPDASNPYANSESEVQQIIATPGKIKDLYLELSNNPGAGADAYRMTLRVNGVSTALVVTITGAATTGSDLTNEVTVAAGDKVCWLKQAISTPANNLSVRAGFAFEADTANESLFINGYKSAMDTSTTKYYPLSHNLRAYDADEFKQWQYAQLSTVSQLYVRLKTAPGIGKSWTFTLRKNGTDTDLTCTISGNDTTGSDLSNSVVLLDDDYVDLKVVPSGTPATSPAFFGALQTAAQEDGVFVEMASLDITDKILGVRTERGKDSELGHAATGIALLTVDNFDGDFSPENSGGAYFGTLDLGISIEVYEVYLGVRYDHFTGKIDKIEPHAELDNLIASIIALDGSDDLNIVEIETALRTATDSNALVGDILDAAAWPAGDRDLDAGVDTFAVAWFHQVLALAALHDLELQEKSFFYIDVDGDAQWEDRHHRLTGAHIISQADFEDTAVELPYEWSKRNIGNYARLTGKRYTIDADNTYLWGIFTGASGAPLVPAGSSITLWGIFTLALASFVALVAGTHWNANTAFNKTGTDVTSDVSLVTTQFGQILKMVFTNAGLVGAYLVIPDTPPAGVPSARTAIVMGKLYQEDEITHIEEDSASRISYGKRSIEIVATYKSNPNDLRAYAEWLIARFKDPVPSAVSVTHKAMTAWPDDTIKIQCLSRKISDRITVKSTKLGVDQDYYINKVIQDYQLRSGIFEHRCTWIVERAEGTAESLYWLLGEVGFSELGETTKLGF